MWSFLSVPTWLTSNRQKRLGCMHYLPPQPKCEAIRGGPCLGSGANCAPPPSPSLFGCPFVKLTLSLFRISHQNFRSLTSTLTKRIFLVLSSTNTPSQDLPLSISKALDACRRHEGILAKTLRTSYHQAHRIRRWPVTSPSHVFLPDINGSVGLYVRQ